MNAPALKAPAFDAKAWLADMEAGGMLLFACYRPAAQPDGSMRGCIRWIECRWLGGPGADRSETVAAIKDEPRRFEAAYLEIARKNGRWEKRADSKTETALEGMGYEQD